MEQTKWHGAAGYRSVRGRTKASTGKHARRMHAHAWPDQTGQRDRSMRTALDMMAPASSTSFHAVSGVLAGAAQQRDGSLAKSYGRSRKFRTNLLKMRRRKKVAKTNSPDLLITATPELTIFCCRSADHIYIVNLVLAFGCPLPPLHRIYSTVIICIRSKHTYINRSKNTEI